VDGAAKPRRRRGANDDQIGLDLRMTDDLPLALRLADAADELTMRRYRALDLRVESKADLTPVTEADRTAERALRDLLARERPGEAVAGEEFGVEEGDATWWLDPIDGTRNYARGIPIWATLIALERDGKAVVGVVSAPALGHRWWAVRSEGAVLDGVPIRASDVARLEDAYLSTTTLRVPRVVHELAARAALARTYSDFWQHVLVAEGRVDVAIELELNPWDWKAPKLIVEEAGGRFTAEPGLYVASNAFLHDQVVTALRPRA
jgi:histidinol-phosphatase